MIDKTYDANTHIKIKLLMNFRKLRKEASLIMKNITYRIVTFLLCVIILAGVFPLVATAADNEPAPITEDTVFHARPVRDNAYVVSAEKYNAYESEHFQILWGN